MPPATNEDAVKAATVQAVNPNNKTQNTFEKIGNFQQFNSYQFQSPIINKAGKDSAFRGVIIYNAKDQEMIHTKKIINKEVKKE